MHTAAIEYYTDASDLQDIVTGDEIISDTWELKEIDGAVYEIDCKKVTKGTDNVGESVSKRGAPGINRNHEAEAIMLTDL